MKEKGGEWEKKRFVEKKEMRKEMNVKVVKLEKGGVIKFEEKNVMEKGIYVMEGKEVYRIKKEWVEVEEGDLMWMREL